MWTLGSDSQPAKLYPERDITLPSQSKKSAQCISFPSYRPLLLIYDKAGLRKNNVAVINMGKQRSGLGVRDESPSISLKRQLQYSNDHSPAPLSLALWQHVNKHNVGSLYRHESHNPSWPRAFFSGSPASSVAYHVNDYWLLCHPSIPSVQFYIW